MTTDREALVKRLMQAIDDAFSDESLAIVLTAKNCKVLLAALTTQNGEQTAETVSVPIKRLADMLRALRFYARGHHFGLSNPDAWDTVSGEPQNYYCDEAGTATVEDGSIAAAALRGEPANWLDGSEDCSPKAIDGELPVFAAAQEGKK